MWLVYYRIDFSFWKCALKTLGPQIVLSVYRDMTLEGYGRTHVPIKPGLHKLDVSLSKPQPSSLLGYIGTFFGYQPELVQTKMLATTEGNSRKFRKLCATFCLMLFKFFCSHTNDFHWKCDDDSQCFDSRFWKFGLRCFVKTTDLYATNNYTVRSK